MYPLIPCISSGSHSSDVAIALKYRFTLFHGIIQAEEDE